MEITNEVIELAERFEPDEDRRQDFYVAWLEMEHQPFETRNQLSAYMSSVLNNRRLNDKAKQARRLELESMHEQDIRENLFGYEESAPDPADMLEAEQEWREMTRGMSDTLRRTFDYLYVKGYTPEETAEAEGIKANAVYQRINSIKQHIKGA